MGAPFWQGDTWPTYYFCSTGQVNVYTFSFKVPAMNYFFLKEIVQLFLIYFLSLTSSQAKYKMSKTCNSWFLPIFIFSTETEILPVLYFIQLPLISYVSNLFCKYMCCFSKCLSLFYCKIVSTNTNTCIVDNIIKYLYT